MHYGVIVIVDKPETDGAAGDIASAVDTALAPFKDREWDWFQIGGRWTGFFDGYEAENDPANIQACELCGGTGDRATFRNEPKDIQDPSGCNGCDGKGTRAKWPTEWIEHPGDVVPVDALTDKHIEDIFAIVTDYDWHGGEKYIPWTVENGNGDSHFMKMPTPPIEWLRETQAGKLAVIVDCHN